MKSDSSQSIGQLIFAVGAFPLALAFALVAPVALPGLGLPMPAAQLLVFIAAMGLSWAAQRVVPFREEWSRVGRKERLADISSLAAVMFAVDPMVKAGLIAALSYLASLVTWSGGLGEVISSLPYLLALAAAVLIAEFFPYWLHRLAHRPGWLWRFHSIHHSPGRIYWLNAFRSHPVNIVWYIGSTFGTLLLLGFPSELIQGYLAVSTVAGVFQHCNGRLRHGVLNWVFSTNEHHRWHHDRQRDLVNCNFGSVLIIWDRIFRTYFSGSSHGPDEVGVRAALWPADASYLTLLNSPLDERIWSNPEIAQKIGNAK